MVTTGTQNFTTSPRTPIEKLLLTGSSNPKIKSHDYATGKIDFNGELEKDKQKLVDFFNELQNKNPGFKLKVGKLISDKGILGNGFSYVLPIVSQANSETELITNFVIKLGISEYNRFLGQNFVVPALGRTNNGILEYDRKNEVFNLGFYYSPRFSLERIAIEQSKLDSKYVPFTDKITLLQEDTSSRRKGLIQLVKDISEIQKVAVNTQIYLTRQLK